MAVIVVVSKNALDHTKTHDQGRDELTDHDQTDKAEEQPGEDSTAFPLLTGKGRNGCESKNDQAGGDFFSGLS
nr:hypothetical protein [uncultured Desulfuromonas sp.]